MRVGLLALALLSGCTMVDRRTLRSTPPAPGAAEQTRATLPPLPLVTIRFGTEGLDWRQAVATVVEEARTRKPDVAFDVLAALPAAAGDEQARALQTTEADVRDVANALLYDGVAADRVHLGIRVDPGAALREVRIYVR